ncbi:MAG: DUF29 domain-containing protein [Symploca sp. SIO1A3]|nr:DUF29 domain-containing protein [Symploca sp. SIO1A3]
MTVPLSEQPSKSYLPSLYEEDFYLWLQATTKLLQQRELAQLDLENLIEELESMGRREKREVKNPLMILIEHLLKLQYWEAEKQQNARGWRNTVIEQQRQLELSLEDSPSLKNVLADSFLDCYQKSRQDTIRKYELPSEIFPVEPPFTLAEVISSSDKGNRE